MDSKISGGRILCYEDGKVIFEEGSIGREVYIIESGKVEVCKRINGKKITVRILGKGDIFGENAMFPQNPCAVTAISIGKTHLIAMRMEEIIYRIQNNLQFAIEFMQSLVSRIHDNELILESLISKIYNFSENLTQDIFSEKKPTRIGEILIEMNFLTPTQLDKCIQRQKEIHIFEYRHKLIGEIIIEMGFVTEEQLCKALAEQKLRH